MRRETHTTASISLTSQEVRDIVAAASTPAERLHGEVLAEETPESADLRQQQLEAWCRQATIGDWRRFQDVLSWNGHTLADVEGILGPVHLHEKVTLPDWTTTLQEVLYLLETMPCEQVLVDNMPSPFEELLSPFVMIAQRRSTKQAGSAFRLLSTEAHATLQHHLLQVLTSLSVDTFYATFSHWRSQAPTKGPQPGDASGEYQQFITWMSQGGLAAFFRRYCFLARLLATTTDLWVEAQVEFYQRLEEDWQEIERRFGGNTALGQVRAIEPALSNPHHGRRCVMALTFADGTKLIYKPRNIGMEVCYARLLNWCNKHGATLPLKVLTTLDRSAYGWVEFVEQKPCQDRQAVERYYQRAGMLLCLVYVLGGIDCFSEHIIASGEHPVLIDPSILLHHYPCPDHRDEPFGKRCSDWEQESFSVLHTGLLACWQTKRDAQLSIDREISGLTMNGQEKSAQQRPQRLALTYGMLRIREPLNIPCYEGNFPPPTEYRAAIATGFMQLYQLLLTHHGALLETDGALQAFREQTVRVVYRDNQDYQALLSKLLQPEYLCDGVAYSLQLERLWYQAVPVEYNCLREANGARWRQVWLAEQRALLQGDIPFFTACTKSDVLYSDRPHSFCLHQPSFDLLLKRLRQLSNSDMNMQMSLIRQALCTQVTPARAENESMKSQSPTSDVLLTHALALADRIAEQAILAEDKTVTWIQPRFLLHSCRYRVQPVRHGIFDGACGVALFLAAATMVSGKQKYGLLARAAVESLRRSLHENGELLEREMGLGGAVGLGSVIYALTRISRFLDDSTVLAIAHEAAHLIGAKQITTDQALDIIAGSAGAILGLLALYEVCHEQKVLDRAVACGHHLLEARTMSNAGCLAWPTLRGRHTTGMSHGTAGIAYALLRLYALTGESDLLNAAQEGLVYEDHAFVSEAGNWAEVVTNEKPEYRITWCHGAPGIGLARIGGLSMLDTARIRQDIEVALHTTQQVPALGPDHLCCGNSGRAEILLTAAQKLARPDLAESAKQTLWHVLKRAEQRGTVLLSASLPSWTSTISFFHGTSGIGYTLLRAICPDILPSVLLWE